MKLTRLTGLQIREKNFAPRVIINVGDKGRGWGKGVGGDSEEVGEILGLIKRPAMFKHVLVLTG